MTRRWLRPCRSVLTTAAVYQDILEFHVRNCDTAAITEDSPPERLPGISSGYRSRRPVRQEPFPLRRASMRGKDGLIGQLRARLCVNVRKALGSLANPPTDQAAS
jgi:hypothetical protein